MKTPKQPYGYQFAARRKYRNRLAFARENRRHPTEAERVLWDALRNRRLGGFKFRRQHIIGVYIVDFVCLSRTLIVEVDGEIHNQGENPELDRDRQEKLQAKGFEILRFTNDEVLNDTERVCFSILQHLQRRPGI